MKDAVDNARDIVQERIRTIDNWGPDKQPLLEALLLSPELIQTIVDLLLLMAVKQRKRGNDKGECYAVWVAGDFTLSHLISKLPPNERSKHDHSSPHNN